MINTLKTLDLSHNAITGKIPPGAWSVPDRTAAHVLVLTASALCVRVATAVFGDMPALVILDLSWNQLSGGIPANMVNFTCVAHAAAAALCARAAALWLSRVTPPPRCPACLDAHRFNWPTLRILYVATVGSLCSVKHSRVCPSPAASLWSARVRAGT